MLPPFHSAHGAHLKAAAQPPGPPPLRPAGELNVDSRDVHEMLEALDDAIFTAISGCRSSLDKAHQLWPLVVASLGPQVVEESREQYLRYAVEVSAKFVGIERRSEQGACAALEIIEMLTWG